MEEDDDYKRPLSISDSVAVGGPEKAQNMNKALMDYKYHITLRCISRQEDFVVSVSDSLKDIHDNWNWIERQLFPKISEISSQMEEGGVQGQEKSIETVIDDFVLSQFDIGSLEQTNASGNQPCYINISIIYLTPPHVHVHVVSSSMSKKRQEIGIKMTEIFAMDSSEILLYCKSFFVILLSRNPNTYTRLLLRRGQ